MNTTDDIPGTSPIEIAEKHIDDVQRKLARAMKFCSDVAKLYKKYGQPPKWIRVTGASNRAMRRQGAKR